MAREAGLTTNDMDYMSVGDVLDYVYSWIDFHNPKDRVRPATQDDIDRMF